MAEEFYTFDQKSVDAALEAARTHYSDKLDALANNATENGHLSIAAQCIAVVVKNGKVCLNLPLGLGNYCIPIPTIIPNGTAAQACLSICTHFGIPSGVEVTISVAGNVIVRKKFGSC